MLTPSMTALEKQIVKALLAKGHRNQDIHALINTGRDPTVNFGRISDVEKIGDIAGDRRADRAVQIGKISYRSANGLVTVRE